MSNDHTNHLADEVQRRGALVLRALPILLIPVFVAVVSGLLLWATLGEPPKPPDHVRTGSDFSPLVPIVVLIIFCTALIVLVRLGRPTISALVMIGGWTLVTTLATLRGGVVTYFPALLIIPICAAGLLIDGIASVSLAALATLLVGSLAWLEMNGLGPVADTPPQIMAILPYISVGFWTALFWTVAALTSLLAGSLQRALRQSRAQAEALGQLSAQLEARVAEQTEQLLDKAREAATLEERTRLSRDIHDTLAQGLTGVVVQLGAAQRALSAVPGEPEHQATAALRTNLDLAHSMARESLAEARRSVWNLRAPALERGDLADALRGLVARPLHQGTSTSFRQQGEAWPLPAAVEGALLRVAQEALANAAKHASASKVELLLEYIPDAVRLSVSDDGVGLDPRRLLHATPAGPSGAFGLLGIRERLAALGGNLALSGEGGTRLVATVPLGRST